MDDRTRAFLLEMLGKYQGDVERCACWIAYGLGIKPIGEVRKLLQEAQASQGK